MTENSYELTKAQEAAVKELEAALRKCNRAGVYLWDDYGSIRAVNGRVVRHISPDDSYGEMLDRSQVYDVSTPKCWHSSNSDDTLYVQRDV